MSNIGNQSALNEALRSLHRYVRSMHISVDLPEIDQEALEEYFNSDDPGKNATFDKFIKAAAVEAIYEDPDIPKTFKAKVARRAANELVDAFRGAKVEYEFATGKYGVGNDSVKRYQRELKMITLCRKATLLDKIKKNLPLQATKIVVKEGLKSGLTVAGFAVGGIGGAVLGFVAGVAVDAVVTLTPKSVKTKLKQKCGELAQKAADTVRYIGNVIRDTRPYKKAKEVVEKHVAPIVKPVYEKAKEAIEKATSKISGAVRKCWKVLKSIFA